MQVNAKLIFVMILAIVIIGHNEITLISKEIRLFLKALKPQKWANSLIQSEFTVKLGYNELGYNEQIFKLLWSY
jgi:hypothetical protein